MTKILSYIIDTYSPDSVIVYGSFADGSSDEDSDFDALVIADGEPRHDRSTVAGTMLDVFIRPPRTFEAEFAPDEFVQILDGQIVLDKSGAAARLMNAVRAYVSGFSAKSVEERRQALGWCQKMLARTARRDAEGNYRHHWLPTDSLEIYFELTGLYYRGPKKALRFLEQNDPEGFSLYSRALTDFSQDSLAKWIAYLGDKLHE